MLYLTMLAVHFIYGYVASITQIAIDETRCHHYFDLSFRLAARDDLYAPSHR